MVLYVGSSDSGVWAESCVTQINENEEIRYTGFYNRIEKCQSQMIEESYRYIIVDVQQYSNSASDIAFVLNTIQNLIKGKIIVYAPGYFMESELITQLISIAKIQYFITAPTIMEQRRTLLSIFSEQYTIPSLENLDVNIDISKLLKDRDDLPFHTIAVAGVCPRIGTTTQAFQIIKYLNYNGYTACYIEANQNLFLDDLAYTYADVEIDESAGKICYQNTDMFYKKERITDILKMGYDFYIYDFGCYNSKGFNSVAFLEKDKSIIICGSSPGEIQATNKIIQNTVLTDIYYIFSFCSPDEFEDIQELMDDKADQTVFADFCPDYFTFLAHRIKLYEPILPVKKLDGSEAVKKRGFFKRKEKK